MIPVEMREENVRFAFASTDGIASELLAERADAAARVDDESLLGAFDLDAKSVAAETATFRERKRFDEIARVARGMSTAGQKFFEGRNESRFDRRRWIGTRQ